MCLAKRIFLVDDDACYVFLTKKIIATTGFETAISEFGNGQKAVDFIKDNMERVELLPDIIFLDLDMPVMDGWGFLDEYRLIEPQIKKKIVLYIVSSSISPFDMNRAKQISIVTDFIAKPMPRAEVVRILGGISNNTIAA